MSDESGSPELPTNSKTTTAETQSMLAATIARAPNAVDDDALSGNKKKRGREASVQTDRPPSVGPDSEDINLHVEAG
ncbi:hypothetical protein IWW38_003856, partial [Coemansia aciculifera]